MCLCTGNTVPESAGKYIFAKKLEIGTDGIANFLDIFTYQVQAETVLIGPGGLLNAYSVDMTVSTKFEAQEGSKVDLSERIVAKAGSGYRNEKVGSGHGGFGGLGDNSEDARGSPYDNFWLEPSNPINDILPGSGGYATKAGGAFKLTSSEDLIVDGIISAK